MNTPEQITYTQVVDDKTGEIKYVPNQPPTPPPSSGGGGHGVTEEDDDANEYESDRLFKAMKNALGIEIDYQLQEVLKRLEDNNKRLRYATRLETGKLDGRRLVAYKTSKRLFKKKAIKHKDYMFNIMIDTSGSMFEGEDGQYYGDSCEQVANSKLKMAVESVIKVTDALEELGIPVAVWAMNNETRLLKEARTRLDYPDFMRRLKLNLFRDNGNDSNMGGTNEMVAYKEVMAYIDRTSHPKQENVVLVLSDGEPGSRDGDVRVFLEDEQLQYRQKGLYDDGIDNLKRYWERQTKVTAYGIGIMSAAKQIPRSRRLDSVDKLPEVISGLIQEIIM